MDDFTLEQRHEVYKRAVAKWGEASQMEMANEEGLEFALAVRKQLRKNNDKTFANLVEEFADLEIMMEQVELIHGGQDFRAMVNAQKQFKINRLIDRINKDSFEALPTESKPE